MQQYLDHKLECPCCGTIRLRIPVGVTDSTEIKCDDCGLRLGSRASYRTTLQSKAAMTVSFGCQEAGSNGSTERLAHRIITEATFWTRVP